jgi:signal transduction histidine kinase
VTPLPRLTVRQWMLVGLLIFAVAASAVFHLISLVDDALRRSAPASPQAQAEVLKTVEQAAGSPGWTDPTWQASIEPLLARQQLGIVLRDGSGRSVFTGGSTGGPRIPLRTVDLVENGTRTGTIELFGRGGFDWLAPIGAVLAVLLAVAFVRWQMGRYLVRPLEAMAVAANNIARGDLDVELPNTTVREVDDVKAAFETMAAGLRESLTRQSQLEEQRRFFIGAVAHDLRTPLFALRGYLTGLEKGLAGSPEKAASYAAVCRQKADQLEGLVEDLFAYTRTEYLQQALRREPIDVGQLLQRAADGMRARADDRGVVFHLERSRGGCLASGDEGLLERAVENLLDNALRYTDAGGRIDIGCAAEGGRATFTIADTGPGIAAPDLPHLFEAFYRGEASRNRQTGGAGLGLSIAKRVLQAHGGDLVAANREPTGAVFTG